MRAVVVFWWSGISAVRRMNWRLLVIAAWAVFLLKPVWRTGWFGDDEINSLERGFLKYERISLLAHAFQEWKGWLFGVGRINPLIYLLKDATFWLFSDLIWYKTALVGLVLINLFAFHRLLRRLGACPDLAALACLLTATLIQFRDAFPDPVLSFNGLMQWLLLATILSLGLYHRYLTGGRRVCLAGGVLLYLAAALTYEMTYPFCLLHLGVFVTTRRVRGGAWTLAPFVAVPVLLTLGSLWLRSLPGCPSGPYSLALNPGDVVRTGFEQFVAALPGSYAALWSRPHLHGVFTWKALAAQLPTFTLGFLTAAPLVWGLVRRREPGGLSALGGLATLGALLATLPVLMVSLARGYQEALRFGLGHLPVYVQYFGVALLLGCGIRVLAGRVRPGGAAAGALVVLAAALCAATAAFHTEANCRVVTFLCDPSVSSCLTPRREIEELLDGGLLANASPDAILAADRNPWDPYEGERYFYCQHTGRRWKYVWTTTGASRENLAALSGRPCGDGEGPALLRVRYVAPGRLGGYAVTGRMHYLSPMPAGS